VGIFWDVVATAKLVAVVVAETDESVVETRDVGAVVVKIPGLPPHPGTAQGQLQTSLIVRSLNLSVKTIHIQYTKYA
jgi:hypothetical protein